MKNITRLWICIGLLSMGLWACKKVDDSPPPNPFDIKAPEVPMPVPPPDSASIIGLHQYIFSKSCAVPGCHDGNFEPDFRTVQSAYSTLVLHPVVKNDNSNSYQYRVKPFDHIASWLYNRVTTNDQVLGRMPLYDNPLSDGSVRAIKDWINAGAPDMFGNVSALPNTQPKFLGVGAFLDFGVIEVRVDSIRSDQFAPFGVLANRDLVIWLRVEDDSTATKDLKVNQLEFTSDPFNWSGSVKHTAQYSASAKIIPDFYGPGEAADFHWFVKVNTANFPINQVTYMRYSVEDGNHAEAFVFPNQDMGIGYQFYMSFFVAQ